MKNSPHRWNHERKKSIRKASFKTPREKKIKLYHPEYIGQNDIYGDLRPVNSNRQKVLFENYIHHLQQKKHWDPSKHARRSAPGEVDFEMPHSHVQQKADKRIEKSQSQIKDHEVKFTKRLLKKMGSKKKWFSK